METSEPASESVRWRVGDNRHRAAAWVSARDSAASRATPTAIEIPGYIPGTWQIDPIHSDAAFSVRHLVTNVRGRFRALEGQIKAADDVLDSTVRVSIAADSIDTNNQTRDDHLRSADFLEAETYPTLTFASTRIRPEGTGFLGDGNLTIKDVTRQITAAVEFGGVIARVPEGRQPLSSVTVSAQFR